MTSKDAPPSGTAENRLLQKSLRVTGRCSTVEATASTTDEMVQFDRTEGGGTGATHGPAEPTTRFATTKIEKIYTGSEEDSTRLLECLITTAKNPWTDDSCDAVVVFDHRRTSSVITKELAREMKLPAASTPTHDLESFTGYYTSIDLLPQGGPKLSLDNLATGPLPPLVRTVLVDEKLLAALRRLLTPLNVISAQPHLLIGADVMN
ncbi:hypothetical protein AAVH_26884 [Aphelenchoides avenae]|nr:hypothetical protein AAVH_26884 [Aphelenchus avenae]